MSSASNKSGPMNGKDEIDAAQRIRCHLGELLKQREMTLTELATRAGITVANLAVLKNGRARAIRFSTLLAVCDALECTPADLLSIKQQPSPTR